MNRFAASCLFAVLAVGAASTLSRADDVSPPAQSAPAQAPASAAQGQPPSAQASPPSAGTAASPQTPPGTAAQPPQPGAPASPGASEAAKPPEANAPRPESSTGETVELAPRPFAYIEGKADRDEVYSAIQGSLGLVRRDMDKAGLKPAGRPLAVFVESDDSGFRYHAGYPLETAPDSKTNLSEAVKIGLTSSGKAMRFQHLGAYADIDATYDAITAYLDEKGIDAQDSFVEEYANDVKDADDPNLEVDIYVLLK